MRKMEPKDYKDRAYLSAIEAAKYLDISVTTLHNLAKKGIIKFQIAGSGQMRFDLKDLKEYESKGLVKNLVSEGCVTIESVKISFYPHAHTSNH
jgi:excisionase family DNA binding protein